jgi:hypothetical protein
MHQQKWPLDKEIPDLAGKVALVIGAKYTKLSTLRYLEADS